MMVPKIFSKIIAFFHYIQIYVSVYVHREESSR